MLELALRVLCASTAGNSTSREIVPKLYASSVERSTPKAAVERLMLTVGYAGFGASTRPKTAQTGVLWDASRNWREYFHQTEPSRPNSLGGNGEKGSQEEEECVLEDGEGIHSQDQERS